MSFSFFSRLLHSLSQQAAQHLGVSQEALLKKKSIHVCAHNFSSRRQSENVLWASAIRSDDMFNFYSVRLWQINVFVVLSQRDMSQCIWCLFHEKRKTEAALCKSGELLKGKWAIHHMLDFHLLSSLFITFDLDCISFMPIKLSFGILLCKRTEPKTFFCDFLSLHIGRSHFHLKRRCISAISHRLPFDHMQKSKATKFLVKT